MTTVVMRRLLLAGAVTFSLCNASLTCANAQDVAARSLAGRVTSADGKPIAGATVSLRGAAGDFAARTDAAGRFAFGALAAGSYAMRVAAPGYDALANRTIGVGAGSPADIALTLARSSSSLVTIGGAQVSGGDALSTSSAPNTTLNAQDYADRGYTRMSDVLQDDISTTLIHPLGGSTVLPTSVALRGPDPTETLVAVDGHEVNNGNSGDFDLSLLDPSAYGSVELVKGISPSSLVGPDTIDGAINIRTLEPTANPHGLLRFTAGSFGSFGAAVQSTGSYGRLGYALSLNRVTTAGEVNQTIFDASAGTTAQIGSAVDGSTALAKVRYAFGASGNGYAEFSFHDQSQFRDLSAALSSVAGSGGAAPAASGDSIGARVLDTSSLPGGATTQVLDGFEGTALEAHNAGYGLDVRAPIGAPDAGGVTHTSVLFRHYSSFVGQSVTGPGADTSPYLYNDRDVVGDDSLELEHDFARASLSAQFDVRNESLTTDYVAGTVSSDAVTRRVIPAALAFRALDAQAAAPAGPSALTLGQTQRSAALRYTYDPTPKLHLTAATYYSDYSIFGTHLDPRLGIAYDPDARSVFRFSVGTTYQAPHLPELYVPPVLPQAVGGYISVGNPNLKPDYATEYGLGFEHVIESGANRTAASIDIYRVNLRAPASTYLPALDPNCGPAAAGGDGTTCPLSYTVNAGGAIYQGIELGAVRRIAPYTSLRAGYAVRSAYLTSVPQDIQNGSLVVGEQALGLPLQKATVTLHAAPPSGFGYDAGIVYEGKYNELNQPPFAVVNAGLSYRFGGVELGVAATNLTDVYDQRFTRLGAGVPYGGLTGPLATDAYALQGTAFTFTLARRF